MTKIIFLMLATVLLVGPSFAQSRKPLKVKVIYDPTDVSSMAVGPLLVQKVAGQPKFFSVVNDDDKDLAIVTDCYRATSNDPYSCFYVANEFLGSNESLLGAAVIVKASPDEAATALFASILQDVAERWNTTTRRMLIAELETCLLLTESSCAVPDPLVAELKTKSINLSQYMRNSLKP